MLSKMTYDVFIKAAPATVFAYIADLTHHGEWTGDKLKVEAITPGPAAVGHRYRSVGDDAFSKNVENQLTVTEISPITRFCFTTIDPRLGANASRNPFTHEFILTAQDGGTRLQRNVIREMSLPMHVMTKYVMGGRVARPLMNRAFAALKQRLEMSSVG